MALSDIEHFVVLMLENHSFDQMLGFSGISGVDAISGQETSIRGLSIGNAFRQDDLGRKDILLPVTADADFIMAHDPGHEFTNVRDQLWGPNLGPNDPYPDQNVGFVYSYKKSVGIGFDEAKRVMAGFIPARLPVLTTLAREFAVCDMWFSSLPGPTWPNRFFVHAATSGGLVASPDPTNLRGDLTKNYDWASIKGFSFKNGHIYDSLKRARLDWRVYHGDHLPQVAVLDGMIPRLLAGDGFRHFDDFPGDIAKGDLPAYTFIEPNYGDTKNFTGGNSQHPVGDIRDGERLIKDVYRVVRASPLWEKTVLVVLYDEHGGFFDHVVPGAAPPTLDDDQFSGDPETFRFDSYGIRVPAVVISPWVRRGTIDHTIYDHASLLKTVETRFGLDALTDRDKKAESFEHLLSLPKPRQDTVSASDISDPPVDPSIAVAAVAAAGAPSDKAMPSAGSFAHLAMLVDLQMSPDKEKAIKDRLGKMTAQVDAGLYISEVKEKIKTMRQKR